MSYVCSHNEPSAERAVSGAGKSARPILRAVQARPKSRIREEVPLPPVRVALRTRTRAAIVVDHEGRQVEGHYPEEVVVQPDGGHEHEPDRDENDHRHG